MALQALVGLHPASSIGAEAMSTGHLLSHVVTFDVSAAAITWIVTRLSAALREREAAARAEQQRRAVTDRLAALGTLAAGVAHELGTPLGAIQLLGEKAARRSNDAETGAAIATLLEQVARCRAILERLRARGTSSTDETDLDLDLWVAEWHRAAPDVEVGVAGTDVRARVAGPEEGWRAALWVALDNARRAGAAHIAVAAQADADSVHVTVDDDGRGLGDEAARHAGEPFWTGWQGTGLGLFVARSFAESVGGDVRIEPGDGRGARVRMRLPKRSR
jgi:two-component system sensor histidine kinase RegB